MTNEQKSCKFAAQEKWDGLELSKVYLGALTESNFHELRQIIEPAMLHYFGAKVFNNHIENIES